MKTPLEYIEQLRARPVHHRKRAAFLATVLIGGSILFTWGAYQSKKLTIQSPAEVLANQQRASQAASPFQALEGIFK